MQRDFLYGVVIGALAIGAGSQFVQSQPAERSIDVTPLGMYDVASFLLLDNRTGEIFKYDKFTEAGRTAGAVEHWGTLTQVGKPITLRTPTP